jgi:hypothetical protein
VLLADISRPAQEGNTLGDTEAGKFSADFRLDGEDWNRAVASN